MPNGECLATGESAWQSAVVYQIYPSTFNEERQSDWLGEGNLKGITTKFDYLKDLGVDAIWLSPFFKSPMVDGGYDVADHTAVDPRYGDLADFNELTSQAHERGIKVMIDLILNHTSDQHDWFKQSRSSRHNPKSDWYIWHDGNVDGMPPNNWASVFSMPQLEARRRGELVIPNGQLTPPLSAWQYDEQRQQFYLHSFAVQQPDLNWQNPEVRQAISDLVRLWVGRGVDGFRADAVNYIGKDPTLANEDYDPEYKEGTDSPYDQLERFHSNGFPATLHAYLRELTAVLGEFPDRDLRLILEDSMDEKYLSEINKIDPKLTSTFNFDRLNAPWDAQQHQLLLDHYYATLPAGAIGNQVNGNHDKPRLASRIGEQAARAAALINYSLPGSIYVYNGEEGGFTNVQVPPDRQTDKFQDRDKLRTPMLWSGETNAGFSEAAEPQLYLPIDPDYRQKNLASQRKDPSSSLALYRRLAEIRTSSELLRRGAYYSLLTNNHNVLAFARRHKNRQLITLANFSDRLSQVSVYQAEQTMGRIIISSCLEPESKIVDLSRSLKLKPNEAVIISSQV